MKKFLEMLFDVVIDECIFDCDILDALCECIG